MATIEDGAELQFDSGAGLYVGASGGPAALEVDGGINRDTIVRCWRAGADTFVAGNAVFSAADPQAEIGALRALCTETA